MIAERNTFRSSERARITAAADILTSLSAAQSYPRKSPEGARARTAFEARLEAARGVFLGENELFESIKSLRLFLDAPYVNVYDAVANWVDPLAEENEHVAIAQREMISHLGVTDEAMDFLAKSLDSKDYLRS